MIKGNTFVNLIKMNKSELRSISYTKLSLVQSFIRHYIGNSQYIDSLILTILKDNDIVMELSNDNLIAFLQNPVWNDEINQSTVYTVSLRHVYEYHFMYENENIDVNIIIAKTPQQISPVNIPTYNWDNIDESCYIECTNKHFIQEIELAIKLNSPDTEHYHLPNKSVYDTIQILNINDVTPNDELYVQYLKLKGQSQLNPKVFQVTLDNFNESNNDVNNINKNINKNIVNFTANMKIDGIRTLIVITNGVIICYQRDTKFKYLYNQQIEGNYIFDCELCRGRLHLFDCYYYNDSDISEYKYTDRVNMIKQFADKYPDFIAPKYISINDCLQDEYFVKNFDIDEYFKRNYIFKSQTLKFENFFKSNNFNEIIQFMNSINKSFNIDHKNGYINAIESILKLDLSPNISKYLEDLKLMLTPIINDRYKNAYDLCKLLKIPYRMILVYSPVLIEGLIGYYNQIGYVSSEEFIKQYSIKFVKECRQSEAKIPISFTEILTGMYNSCEYDNDGVIFTFNGPMSFDPKSTIYYKWKPRDKLSADVKLEFDMNDITEINNKRYVFTKIMIDTKNVHTSNHETEMELNNFNNMLPKCINEDIIQSGNIVEVVPLWNGLDWTYIPLRIRYDKVYTNSKQTIENIYSFQKEFINIIC